MAISSGGHQNVQFLQLVDGPRQGIDLGSNDTSDNLIGYHPWHSSDAIAISRYPPGFLELTDPSSNRLSVDRRRRGD